MSVLGVAPDKGVTSSQLPPEVVATVRLKVAVEGVEAREMIWCAGSAPPCGNVKLSDGGEAVNTGAVCA